MGLHIDDVRAPRGRLPESEGGALALVGIHPEYDLPAHAVPLDKGGPAEPVVETPVPAAAAKPVTHHARHTRKT